MRVFDYEPDLLSGVPRDRAEQARRGTAVRSLRLERGKLQDIPVDGAAPAPSLLILDGLLLRSATVLGQSAVELLGPGDVLRGDHALGTQTHVVRPGFTWRVCEPTRLAVLDHEFEEQALALPGVATALLDRVADRADHLAVQLSLAGLGKLDERLLAMLWYLAERFGRVEPIGVALQPRFRQETLAQLVAARRASVNTALRTLRESGRVMERSPGKWVLLGVSSGEFVAGDVDGELTSLLSPG